MKKQLITLVCILVPLLGFVIYGFWYTNQEDRLLKEEPVYSTAIIVETYVGTKVRNFVRFEFSISDKIYDGHQQYFPKIENIEVGDTCEVVYAKSNPEINRLLTNDDKSLKVKRRSKEFVPFLLYKYR